MEHQYEPRARLAPATADADAVFWYQPEGMDWSLEGVVAASTVPAQAAADIDALVRRMRPSNGAGLDAELAERLRLADSALHMTLLRAAGNRRVLETVLRRPRTMLVAPRRCT